jgi:multidrug efflux pump subunit AcrA (membrane-fusion protein)
VNPGTLVGRIRQGEREIELRANISGRIERWLARDGAAVLPADGIASIAPSADMVWEALRALALIGRPEDEIDIEFYLHPIPGMPVRIENQARETIRSIQKRHATQNPARSKQK